jgi:hypothetical protein
MGLWLVGRRPVLSKGWLFQQPRPERHLHVRVPALSMGSASVASWHLTYELLRKRTSEPGHSVIYAFIDNQGTACYRKVIDE